ncbi:hypothetical protein KUF71_011651 [Frankliniella fusca]|uniref:Uncharacterized protein n=1 Tax=Frankliniella fusca TaxID=407009 RepID=A0AAE1HK51_9NEOP|nr:hypothetical protein KUF71_008125 [Frankliniella fusca]KAK3922156.1 hypothetical protein KUF71_011651 [Frankliniella fusca]
MAFMHSASVEALPTELSLWLSNATQLGEDSCQWIVLSPLANFDSATTIELEAPGVGYAYLDPAHMLLYIKQKIVNADGSDIAAADNSDATLVNYGLHAQFCQIDASINGTVISQSSMTYPWRAYIEAFLNYDKAAKDTHLQQRMWHEDTAGHHDSLDSNQNLGLAWRRARTKLSREFEMMGPLHLDICNTDRLLLNNCTLRVKLTRSRDAFALMSTKGTEKIKLLDVKLYVRRVNISPSVLLAHAQALEKSPAKYPVNRVDIKTVTIAQGMHSKTIDNLFMNQLPQRVIIGFVDNHAYNGDYARNPYNFQHFNLNYLQLHVDGQAVPSHPLTPDFSKDLYMECYNTLFSGTGIHWKDEGNGISWSDYPKGNTLFVFDLSPDLSASEPHWNLQRQGTMRLDLRFAAPLAQPINCVVYAEFQNLIEIDKDRNVIVDYSV